MIDKLIKAAQEENWHRASSLLYEHWSNACPKIYGITHERPWESRTDEQKINDDLLYPLSAMSCLSEGDSKVPKDSSLKKLADITGLGGSGRRPGQICGKVFKNGEPTYTCKECATDGTCVMCYECFNQSFHRQHKYKMHASGGGGFCDCGDPEAWSKDFACRLHTCELQPGDENLNLSVTIPKEICARICNLSILILKYAVNLLCSEDNENLPDFLEKPDSNEIVYHTVLFNDETHTYDAVIRALELSIHCSENEAMLLATIVDREGRSIVKVGQSEICENVKTQIQRRTQRDRNSRTQKGGPLEVKVLASYIMFHQAFAVRLLNWLTNQTRVFPPLSGILGEVLLDECVEGCGLGRTAATEESLQKQMHLSTSCQHSTPIVKMMLFDRKLWKSARAGFHQLLMSTVLMDTKQKQEFGRVFIRNYKELMDDYIDDDHEHSVSIVSMSVQVLTVPTVARYLITEENAIHAILTGLVKFCDQYLSPSPSCDRLLRYDFSQNTFPAILKRALCMFTDVGYLLTVIPKPEEWNDKLRTNFLNGISKLLEFLKNIQGMDEIKRAYMEHQLMESEWETAFNIFIRMEDTLSMFIAWAKTDAKVHYEIVNKCLHEMGLYTSHMPEFSNHVNVEVNGYSANCINFDVSKNVLSIHQPIWRFLAGLFTASPDILTNYIVKETKDPASSSALNALNTHVNLKDNHAMLLEMPLRVLVLYAQTHAQLWRRNGFSLINQIHNYNSPLCRFEMYDRDVLMLQVVAALSDPTSFLIRLYDRFGLAKWAQLGSEDLPLPTLTANTPTVPSATPEELSKITVLIAEEMLHLLIIILGERYIPGVGKNVTFMDSLKREIIHLLCSGPKPFSFIERQIPMNTITNKLLVEEAAFAVGDLYRPVPTAPGAFQLKESFRAEYNPFFYHFSKQSFSQTEQFQKKERANAEKSIAACPPPLPPPFEPFFEPINNILESPLFVKLIRAVFERFIKRSRFASEPLLHRGLFLTGMALNEQQNCLNDGKQFNFLDLAEQEGILELLVKLETLKVETHGELIWFITHKYKEVKAAIHGDERRTSLEKPSEPSHQIDAARKAAIAAKKRQIALAQMQKLQKSFKNQHKEFLKEEKSSETETVSINIDDETELGFLPEDGGFPVCCGRQKSTIKLETRRQVTCILCQEDQVLNFSEQPGRAIVCAAFIQESTLLSQRNSNGLLQNDFSGMFTAADLKCGISVSTCGHTLHFDCYKAFTESLTAQRLRPRQQMLGPRAIDPENNEYLCPLCKRLSNCALPLLPVVNLLNVEKFSEGRPPQSDETFDEWITKLKETISFPTRAAAPKKTHSRKRSHSEQSLAECRKADAALESSLSSSVSALETALSIDSPEARRSQEDRNSIPANFPLSDNEEEDQPDQQVVADLPPELPPQALQAALDHIHHNAAAVHRYSETGLIEFLHSGLEKIRNRIMPPKCLTDNVPASFSIWPMVKLFCKALYDIQPMDGVPRHFIEMICVYKATAFALLSVSNVLKEENKPLFGAFNTRQKDCINGLVRLSAVIGFNCRTIVLRLFLSRLLTPLLSPILQKDNKVATSKTMDSLHPSSSAHSSPTSSKFPFTSHTSAAKMLFTQPQNEVNILEVDMLTLTVELAMCIGWSWVNGEQIFNAGKSTNEAHKIPDGSLDEQYIIRLTLIAHLFQVIATFDSGNSHDDMEVNEEQNPQEFDAAHARLAQLYKAAHHSNATLSTSNLTHLHELLHRATINFLRPLAILYNAITLIPPPEALKDPSFDEFEPLCRYMGLPHHIEEILEAPCADRLFAIWAFHLTASRANDMKLVRQPIIINKLINLPVDFSDLVNMAANFRCPSIQMDDPSLSSMMPSLCLVCGKMLCSQSYCCQRSLNGENVGACTFHMHKCSGSSGVFLRIRECQIIFLTTRRRGCFKPAPYIDEFGETDPGFRRGNPLHLNIELYRKIQRLWLHQEIAEEVINQYEINHRNITYDWHHF